MQNNELMLDVGQANEFKLACRREGFTNEDIKTLCERKGLLAQVRGILLGHLEIKPGEHMIDSDVGPFIPDGWSVEEHRKGGQLKWDPTTVQLHLSKNQQSGKCIEGNKLRKELAGKPVLNANVLDYLLKNPHLIPEEWKGTYVFFWGTVYRDSDGDLYVRYLCWLGGGWRWDASWLGGGWDGRRPAAVSAS